MSIPATQLDRLLHQHETMQHKPLGRIGDAKKYFNNYSVLAGQYAYIINIAQGLIQDHKGFDRCLGYDPGEVNLNLLYTLYHPEEADTMQAIVTRAWQTLDGLRLKPFELHFLIDYRVRKADGEYIRVLRQSTNLETDLNLKSTVTFSVCSDITSIKNSGPISYQWITPDGSRLLAEDLLNTLKIKLSKRETDILLGIARGLTNEEISVQLHLSAHTVATHRKNMLKRTGLKSTAQLIVYAVWNKII